MPLLLLRSPRLLLRLFAFLLLAVSPAAIAPIVSTPPAIAQQATPSERLAEADRLNRQGIEQLQTSQYREALRSFEQALAIYRETPVRAAFPQESRNGEADMLNNLGIAYRSLSEYQQAIDYYQQALPIFQSVGDRNGEAIALGNLGNVYLSLSEYQQAIDYYQQALPIFQSVGDRNNEANVLGSLGTAYRNLSEYQQAIDYYQQALPIFQSVGDRNGTAKVLSNLGNAYRSLSEYQQAIDYYQQALPIFQSVGDRNGEAIVLNNLGTAYRNLSEYQQAIDYYQQALPIYQAVGDRAGTGGLLANIGKLLEAQDQPELAIAFLKQSVNVRESIRAGIQGLDQTLQQTYADSVANDYRRLADLLLSQGRILEAQQVLELLKVQELRELTRGVVEEIGGVRQVDRTEAEAKVLADYGGLIDLGQKIAQCEAVRPVCANRDALLDQRDALTAEYTTAVAALIEDVRVRFGQDTAALNPEQFIGQAGALLRDRPYTMLIYPLVLDDKLWILWGTSGGVVNQIEVRDVNLAKLSAEVNRFRQIMQDCEAGGCGAAGIPEVQAAAADLYRSLIPPPLEAELQRLEQQAKDEHKTPNLIFSLDRVTRYIPTAALFDGEKYLIERFAVSTVLSAGLTRTDKPLPADPAQTSVLALGLTEAVPENPNENTPRFSALDYAGVEVSSIVQEGAQGDTGIFRGEALLDDQFDDRAFRNLLDRQILHIATHGEFVPIRHDLSYLVLGTKQPLRISQLQNLQQDFASVSLVVLSACETALGETGQDGVEINGIAHTFIQAGVNTVIASLWQVNDRSTSVLMQNFYGNLAAGAAGDRVNISQALRQAQVQMIQGRDAGGGETRSGDGGVVLVPDADHPDLRSTRSDYAHPYYWSPFVIIGSGF